MSLQQSSTVWFRLDTDGEEFDNLAQWQLDDGVGDFSVYELDWTRLPHSPLGRDGPTAALGLPQWCRGGFSLDGFGGLCEFGRMRSSQQSTRTQPPSQEESTKPQCPTVLQFQQPPSGRVGPATHADV